MVDYNAETFQNCVFVHSTHGPLRRKSRRPLSCPLCPIYFDAVPPFSLSMVQWTFRECLQRRPTASRGLAVIVSATHTIRCASDQPYLRL